MITDDVGFLISIFLAGMIVGAMIGINAEYDSLRKRGKLKI